MRPVEHARIQGVLFLTSKLRRSLQAKVKVVSEGQLLYADI